MHSAGNIPLTAAETAAVRSVLLELLGDVDVLAERFVVALLEIVPYSDGAVPRPQLFDDGVNTYERVLRRLLDLPVPERLVELSRGLGRHRAQIDVPLSAVTTGTRLHFRVVWEELADRLTPEALAAAVTLPVQLWQAVEEHSTDVQVGFHEAATALAYERDRDRRRIVEAFLDSDGGDEGLLVRAAGVLGAGVGDDVFCAFVPSRRDLPCGSPGPRGPGPWTPSAGPRRLPCWPGCPAGSGRWRTDSPGCRGRCGPPNRSRPSRAGTRDRPD